MGIKTEMERGMWRAREIDGISCNRIGNVLSTFLALNHLPQPTWNCTSNFAGVGFNRPIGSLSQETIIDSEPIPPNLPCPSLQSTICLEKLIQGMKRTMEEIKSFL